MSESFRSPRPGQVAGVSDLSKSRPSKNPYVELLSEIPRSAFAGDRISAHKGTWLSYVQSLRQAGPDDSLEHRFILEIGCSNGTYLAEIAHENRGVCFCGMDWKFKLVYKGCKKAQSLGVDNAIFMRARAQDISKIFARGELDEVWIFFPDPWPKAAQQKHRLIQEGFLKDLRTLLKPGGNIFIKTDHPGYFQWIGAIFGMDDIALGIGEAPLPSGGGAGVGRPGTRDRQILHRGYINKDLPAMSHEAMKDFQVVATSGNFWADQGRLSAEVQGPVPLFFERATLFEKLFIKDALPIHYLHLRAR